MSIQQITESDYEKLARSFAINPDKWVIILGNHISYGILNQQTDEYINRNELIVKMAKKAISNDELNPYDREQIFKAAENKDFCKMETVLFGDIWDAALFVDSYRMKKLERRNELCQKLIKTEQVNVELAKIKLPEDYAHLEKVNLLGLLKIFKGIILTTCQDETIEAFMEYEKSMLIDSSNVCTPYSLLTLPKWKRRLNNLLGNDEMETKALIGVEEFPILIKLYGSCDKPNRMLLSEWDFEAHYPLVENLDDESNQLDTVKILKKIFRNRHLLFIGFDKIDNVELKEMTAFQIPIASGIQKLLDRTENKSLFRFYLPGIESTKINKFISDISELVEKYKAEKYSKRDNSLKTKEKMQIDQVENYFYELYTRRPKEGISSGEKEILRRILDVESEETWNAAEVGSLAMLADNLADFYDLKDVLNYNLTSGANLNKGKIIRNAIIQDLDKESLELLFTLYKYGNGFPSGFLTLLAKNDSELYKLKSAAIRLENSGVCTKGQQRKYIHKRMKYADIVMLTAGTESLLDQDVFQGEMEDIDRQINDSYFFLWDNFTNEYEKDYWALYDSTVKTKLERLCKKLFNVFTEKSEGYSHYRALLQTEMPQILKVIDYLDNDPAWKASVIYCLFLENEVVRETDITQIDVNTILQNLAAKIEEEMKKVHNGEIEGLILGKVKLKLIESFMGCQSRDDYVQKKALSNCFQAIRELYKLSIGKTNKEEYFKLRIEGLFLLIKIYGRRSTIKELARCHARKSECPNQMILLDRMKQVLIIVEKILNQKNEISKFYTSEIMAKYHFYMGEYFFKKSQYLWENIQYGADIDDNDRNEMDKCYVHAEDFYNKALDYYKKYPEWYCIERAHAERSIGDTLCQKEKSGNGENKTIIEKCFLYLYDAYRLYRKSTNLHGIADILQSMGNAQHYNRFYIKDEIHKRSSICFYNAAMEIYQYFGDEWNVNIVNCFRKGVLEARKSGNIDILFEKSKGL